MSDPDWTRLGEAIRTRRMEMGAPRQSDLAQAAGVSDTTWNLAETGKVVSARSLARIAPVLGWTIDSPQRVLDGGDPVLTEQQSIHLSASGVDLHELEEKDPEAYAAIMRQAEIALARAREREGRR